MEKNRKQFSQMLGNIKWDDQKNMYYIDNSRPQFKGFVECCMNTGLDRCHSISFYLLSLLMCDFANYLASVCLFQEAVTHMEVTFGRGIAHFRCIKDNCSCETYLEQLANYSYKLKNNINNAQSKKDINDTLSQFLSHLNSCPYNLRYPKYPKANWNQAVGKAFDPYMWCYVDDNGNVISDDTYLDFKNDFPNTSLQEYCQYRNLSNISSIAGSGFYILDEGDGYLLSRMMDLATQGFLSQQYINNPQLSIMTSVSNHRPYIASSSNNYPLQPKNQFKKTIYYRINNQWEQFKEETNENKRYSGNFKELSGQS